MHILVIGAAGMIGRKLVDRLLAERKLGGKAISKLSLQDVVAPAEPREKPFEISTRTGDLSVPGEAAALVADNPDVIFHLAAIVSGEAETDFEKGYRINLDGTRFLYDAIRTRAYLPRIVFTSSAAVYGAPFDGAIHLIDGGFAI